ncbi:MAG TPA: hypothetical protein VFW87_25490 [Pirellulales bacterium]|nr:hypothetical protein [Pirellulales bacterium]
MEYRDEIPPDLLLALDACRPGNSDSPGNSDRQLPEVSDTLARHPAALVDRAQRRLERADRAIAASLQRTPVPEGLAERILASLAHQPPKEVCAPAGQPAESYAAESCAAENCAAENCAAENCAAENRAAASKNRLPRSRPGLARLRRPRIKLAVGAAAAVTVAGLLAFAFRPAREIDLASVEQLAQDFYATDDHGAELSTAAAPGDFPLDTRLASARVYGWRRVAGGFLARPAVAYEMASRRGAVPATLYVFSSRSFKVAGAGPAPRTPISTGGLTVGVWQDARQVYVLVVQGGQPEFQSFFPPSPGVV